MCFPWPNVNHAAWCRTQHAGLTLLYTPNIYRTLHQMQNLCQEHWYHKLDLQIPFVCHKWAVNTAMVHPSHGGVLKAHSQSCFVLALLYITFSFITNPHALFSAKGHSSLESHKHMIMCTSGLTVITPPVHEKKTPQLQHCYVRVCLNNQKSHSVLTPNY